MNSRGGTDVIGIRYRRVDIDGVQVMVTVLDERTLTESPSLEERVGLAAKLLVMELRTDPVNLTHYPTAEEVMEREG